MNLHVTRLLRLFTVLCRVSNRFFPFRNLLSNPFICNCHLAWFSEWLQKHDLSGGSPRCHSPPRVKDVPIHELPHHEFKCTSMLQKDYVLLSSQFRNYFCFYRSQIPFTCIFVFLLPTLDSSMLI